MRETFTGVRTGLAGSVLLIPVLLIFAAGCDKVGSLVSAGSGTSAPAPANAATAPSAPSGAAQDTAAGPLTLAVGTIAGSGIDIPEQVMNTINDVFYASLAETGKFTLVERGRMDDLNKEFLRSEKDAPAKAPATDKEADLAIKTDWGRIVHKLADETIHDWSQNGERKSVSPVNQDDLIKIRGAIKADYMVIGVVEDFFAGQTVKQSDSLGQTRASSALTITMDVRMVNTATTQIVTAPAITVERPKVADDPNNPLDDRLQKLQIEIAREGARKAALSVVNALYPISVANVAKDRVYLNRGTSLGVEAGQTYRVVAPGTPIVDPDTKKEIGREEEYIGDDQLAVGFFHPESGETAYFINCAARSEATVSLTLPAEWAGRSLEVLVFLTSATYLAGNSKRQSVSNTQWVATVTLE